MAKKILIVLGVALLALVSFYFYQRFTFEQQINNKLGNLSAQQKNQVRSAINNATSEVNQIQKNVSDKTGITFPSVNNKNVVNAVVNAQKAGADAAIKMSMQNIDSIAKMYVINHQNYGVSVSNNACVNSDYDSFVSAIQDMNKYSFIPASCVVDNNFPAKSFTIIVPYPTESHKMYCTDQNGFAGIVDDNFNLQEGVKCK